MTETAPIKPTKPDDVNSTLFWFCVLWNIVYLAASIYAFFDPDLYVPRAMTIIYLSLVGSYTLHKEINKWNGKFLASSRPGQIIFIGWLSVALLMLVIEFWTKGMYKFSIEMFEFCLGLIAIFVGNEVSKSIRSRPNGNGNGNGNSSSLSK